ncbi:MAG: copper amine oxidase N-terminal domain-containing protein [Clostridia bacterium]|nr:copper amine oxidase N-terminal domain-containing protein [Clostridia bacterium]
MNKFFTKALAGAAAITILTSAAGFAEGVNGPLNTVYETIDNVIMVPLRSNAEGLGYTVEWDGETNTVFISSGAQFATFTIGEDAYTIAKTAPMSLGSAPILFGGDTTYVPLTFFTELLNINARLEDNGYVLTVPNLVTLTSIEEDGSLSVQDENYGEVIVRIDENTEITADGKSAERDMLAAGQLLDIEYNGIMTRSIPPQTTAVRIDIQNMPETVEYHDAKILSVDAERKRILTK